MQMSVALRFSGHQKFNNICRNMVMSDVFSCHQGSAPALPNSTSSDKIMPPTMIIPEEDPLLTQKVPPMPPPRQTAEPVTYKNSQSPDPALLIQGSDATAPPIPPKMVRSGYTSGQSTPNIMSPESGTASPGVMSPSKTPSGGSESSSPNSSSPQLGSPPPIPARKHSLVNNNKPASSGQPPTATTMPKPQTIPKGPQSNC